MIRQRVVSCWLLVVCLSLSASFDAQAQVQWIRKKSGTGFFINNEYVITNAHVVEGCKDDVTINGAFPKVKATVTSKDAGQDLALIRSSRTPPDFAPLRLNIEGLAKGDRVYILGYPGNTGANGLYTFGSANVEALEKEVTGKPGVFYISDVVDFGNSGGPVFDTSGNVIGVVVAKSTLKTVNKETQQQVSERPVGVVITLQTLKSFLNEHGVDVQWSGSALDYSDSIIEENVRRYIVHIECTEDSVVLEQPASTQVTH